MRKCFLLALLLAFSAYCGYSLSFYYSPNTICLMEIVLIAVISIILYICFDKLAKLYEKSRAHRYDYLGWGIRSQNEQ